MLPKRRVLADLVYSTAELLPWLGFRTIRRQRARAGTCAPPPALPRARTNYTPSATALLCAGCDWAQTVAQRHRKHPLRAKATFNEGAAGTCAARHAPGGRQSGLEKAAKALKQEACSPQLNNGRSVVLAEHTYTETSTLPALLRDLHMYLEQKHAAHTLGAFIYT